jgi:5,10-methylenetetrahydromethanopterin reductase
MSCAFPPSMDSPEHAVLAEGLGFRRAYFYDSPALYSDTWVQLCRAAERTTHIGLGPAVLVPSNRHVMTNAAAIATLVSLAGPERVSVAVGSGRTARLGLGQRPLRWADVAEYVRALRSLLRGDVVDWDGARISMLHGEGFGAARPIEVEILIAASGPKGLAVAHEVGDGAFGGQFPVPGFDRSPCMTWGTVLDAGEDPGSPRALDAAGPAHAVFAGHYPLVFGDPAEDSAPLAAWRAEYMDAHADEKHLAVHAGHLTRLTDRDRPHVDGAALAAADLALTPSAWREKLAGLAGRGATEIVYQPAGADVPGELDRFARMCADSR